MSQSSSAKYGQLMQDVENTYKALTGQNFDFLRNANIVITEITTFMLLYDFNKRDINHTIEHFLNIRFSQVPDEIKRECIAPLQSFLAFYDRIEEDDNYSSFISDCAEIYLGNYRNVFVDKGFQHPKLPQNPIPNTSYLDLASGFNFIDFYPQLHTGCEYYLTDISAYSCKCLEVEALKYPDLSISILQKDIMQLERTDIKGEIGLIRAKNIYCYVPEFPDKLEELASWIQPGGCFIFQEHTQSRTIYENVYFDIPELFIGWGWKYQREQGDIKNPLALDTVKFIKTTT